jgi:hypothetical protein
MASALFCRHRHRCCIILQPLRRDIGMIGGSRVMPSTISSPKGETLPFAVFQPTLIKTTAMKDVFILMIRSSHDTAIIFHYIDDSSFVHSVHGNGNLYFLG